MISDELIASFLDGRTDAAGTMAVLKAASEDKGLRDYLSFARNLDVPDNYDDDSLPLLSIAADDGLERACDLKCELYVLRHFGINSSLEEIASLARERGWFGQEGIALHDMGRIIESKGLSVARRYYSSVQDLQSTLSEGMDIILAIDGGELTGIYEDEMIEDLEKGEIPDHAVVLMMIDTDEKEVILYDPAQGEIPVTVDLNRFLDAWNDSGNYMLSITTRDNRARHYHPAPINLTDVEIDSSLIALRESIAENAHEVWAYGRMADGWTYGEYRDDKNKRHPDLLPYSDLPESEKEYDRETAMNTIKLLKKLGYSIEKIR